MALPSSLILRDVIGNIPTASTGTAGRIFVSTDEHKVYRDNGSSWDEILSSSARNAVVNVSADGAISIPTVNTSYYITKAGVAAMTLADPTATTHDGVRLTFISTTAQAHTLDNTAGSGFNNGGTGTDFGTWGGAIGDGIVLEAYQGIWYIVPGSNLNVTLS